MNLFARPLLKEQDSGSSFFLTMQGNPLESSRVSAYVQSFVNESNVIPRDKVSLFSCLLTVQQKSVQKSQVTTMWCVKINFSEYLEKVVRQWEGYKDVLKTKRPVSISQQKGRFLSILTKCILYRCVRPTCEKCGRRRSTAKGARRTDEHCHLRWLTARCKVVNRRSKLPPIVLLWISRTAKLWYDLIEKRESVIYFPKNMLNPDFVIKIT